MTNATATTTATSDWELVIGLEVHCQLKTRSKIFCGCHTSFGDAPNANTCPVCLGLPGALPVLNAHAVELATRASLALGCTVHETSVFARKNYFYPDLPKGYQISQFDRPLATEGAIVVGHDAAGIPRVIRVHRVHMEEDAGKSVHDRFADVSAIDLNRAGTPLVEIVSEPDIRSAEDAVSYARRLKQILEYAEVSDANMEEGSLRVDVNISVRRHGEQTLGTKTEIKNLNSFSAIERAVDIEFVRQCTVLAAGGIIEQQTMLYDDKRQQVRPARSKEGSHDYRYFPEPDLPPLRLSAEYIAAQGAALPELPPARRERFVAQYGLGLTEVEQLVVTRELADRFEAMAAAAGDARRAANWMLGPVLAAVNASGQPLSAHPVSPERLGALIRMEASGELSNTAARQLFTMLEQQDGDPLELARGAGLLQVRDDGALVGWIDEVLAENPAEAARFLSGEKKLQGVLVGLVMKKSKGAADPKKVNQLLGARAD
ncbi:Asp-tRNA(Asn)/Glu-tRNA(Gln) amidotransferase subunit GatB [Gemmatimonas phototrophica]|uniref:Aspartyl/glutamyl-tRNA(Asn/Gln) amidotransferase subunit B n=1 Tax=Gemmatimonas phototrophica TaxID=1379270 RepID=A0A143BK94_9BACT|nr:Asp-tRNA(Asn)/Glu-tRNA(Gln) amidotransferase subunit GatB [Gemmatimonas phototrophica]AMW04854.1 glutamyl-tRNA amidotransferase [Gemmatimonas phototrophica]